MRKNVLSILLITMVSSLVYAGGIVTNSNQSAAYVRMLARDASTGIDAVYYNPAGLTRLPDGLHISLSNQSIFQKKTIENMFPLLHDAKFVGDVVAPLFPDFYAVYKRGKMAVGFGIQPNSGGGSAKYNKGLPSFEIPVAAMPSLLSASGIPTTDYSADISFEGSSVFWGAQVNAAYQVNDMISVSVGGRAIFAKNTYSGHLRNILINPNHPLNPDGAGSFTSASGFFNILSQSATTAANSVDPLITGGGGSLTLSQAVSANYLTPEQANQLAAGLGYSDYNNTPLTIQQIQTAYQTNAATMGQYAASTADKEVDAEQTATAFAPILGLNLTFGEKLNIGLKYEFKTKLTLTNHTKVDGTGLFPDGAEIRSDIPAILSVGACYKVLPQFRISGGMHYYFDKDATIEASPGVKKTIEGNYYELACGMEYDISEKILISAGYLYAKTGVGVGYQTDLSHSLTSSTVGFGGRAMVTEKMGLNLGMLFTMYNSDSKLIDYSSYGIPSAAETYARTNIVFSIGVDYHF